MHSPTKMYSVGKKIYKEVDNYIEEYIGIHNACESKRTFYGL